MKPEISIQELLTLCGAVSRALTAARGIAVNFPAAIHSLTVVEEKTKIKCQCGTQNAEDLRNALRELGML